MPKAGSKWSTMEIQAKGRDLSIMFDGKKTASVRSGVHTEGPVALQFGEGVVKFRKVLQIFGAGPLRRCFFHDGEPTLPSSHRTQIGGSSRMSRFEQGTASVHIASSRFVRSDRRSLR
jgi:hypothetical protein